MIETFKDRHFLSTIAILGSGPSLEFFEGKEDVSIATNGASELDIPYDYFMCEDIRSPSRPWFENSQKHPNCVRIIHSFISVHDQFLFPNEEIRKNLQKEIESLQKHESQRAVCMFMPTFPPSKPHGWFVAHPLSIGNLHYLPDPKSVPFLLGGGSISCTAMQMAYIMGAKQINLYGCSMDNESGDNYYFNHGKIGEQQPYHKKHFERMIQFLSRQVSISIRGESNLFQS